MGRKQKLRREKRKNKAAVSGTGGEKNTTTATTVFGGYDAAELDAWATGAAAHCGLSIEDAALMSQAFARGDSCSSSNISRSIARSEKEQDSDFPPTSEFAVSLEDIVSAIEAQDQVLASSLVSNLLHGAMEDGCIDSFHRLGCLSPICFPPYHVEAESRMLVTTNMWCFWLEGAIRGSVTCTLGLLRTYDAIIPPPKGLLRYWHKMDYNYRKWSDADRSDDNCYLLDRFCVICGKTDTDTLTLLQCKGCSTYCYCE